MYAAGYEENIIAVFDSAAKGQAALEEELKDRGSIEPFIRVEKVS